MAWMSSNMLDLPSGRVAMTPPEEMPPAGFPIPEKLFLGHPAAICAGIGFLPIV